jgi:hypothetical protein
MLPDHLFIADTVAASLVFDPALTARDRAIMLAVSWYAGQHPPADGEEEVMVPELGFRRALGDMRRPDAGKEFARYARLEHATLRGDETVPDLNEGVLVPTVAAKDRRRTQKGNRPWLLEPGIVRTFTPEPGDVTVGVPLVILQRARSRYTLQLLLHLLAWGSGNHPAGWLRRRTFGHRVLRVPLKAILADLGIDPKKKPADVIRNDLLPAIDEIRQLMDLEIDLQVWYAPSIRQPRGRVMGFDILVGDVDVKIVPAPKPTAEILPMQGFARWVPPGSDATDEDIPW